MTIGILHPGDSKPRYNGRTIIIDLLLEAKPDEDIIQVGERIRVSAAGPEFRMVAAAKLKSQSKFTHSYRVWINTDEREATVQDRVKSEIKPMSISCRLAEEKDETDQLWADMARLQATARRGSGGR
jgi:hypothetical protein